MRVVIWDRTCGSLSRAWWLGTKLYATLGRVDRSLGVTSWPEALDFAVQAARAQPLAELQFWGHGKWGDARVDREVLDERSLLAGSPLHDRLRALRCLLAKDALIWFRTCETFGAVRGQSFACALSDFMGCRVAGHTYVIAAWQSGLHALDPGARPSWDPAEGLCEGTPERPQRANHSTPLAPNTITCFDGSIPAEFVDHST